ncbi:MAG: hypothetical protein ABL921_33475, partial [Pirellula sp.]
MRSYLPVLCFIAFLVVGDLVCFQWTELHRSTSQLVQAIVSGCVFGQLLLISFWGGCFGRTWLHGLIAVSLVWMFVMSVGAWMTARDEYMVRFSLQYCCMIPTFVIVMSFPMLMMRFVFGWTLSRTHEKIVCQRKLRIEDLLGTLV